MTNKLEQLRSMTDVVADTGDLQAIEKYKPQDATTNPSLLLQAAGMGDWHTTLSTVSSLTKTSDTQQSIKAACEAFSVAVGIKIIQLIPGRVSTEVDARLSFDTQATIRTAQQIIEKYDNVGVSSDRILIKIAATWEGIKAAEQLEKEGINCNLTLLFNFAQAAACADSGVFLISPFVGRILDWYMARGETPKSAARDPGVMSVSRIYRYYKSNSYSTVVMGASFRNTQQIEELAGCDRLTISPSLLESLAGDDSLLEQKLGVGSHDTETKASYPHETFLWDMNNDAMAHEKLADGIRKFTADQIKLEQVMANHLRTDQHITPNANRS
ncbi:MAG: transaldolase [Arenicellaceae bacterium]|nr:transaldolase [Arenicellaceae bacterium]